MKKGILFLCFMVVASVSAADVYVLFNSADKSIYTVSEGDDTVLPKGVEKVVLSGTIEQLGLSKNPTKYNYIDGEFIINNDKINADIIAAQDASDYADDMALINKKMKELAFDDLAKDGVTLKNVKKKDDIK